MTQGELAAYIDSHLKERGIAVVLSGGAAVAVYSEDKYVSKDLDFVPFFPLDHGELASIMMEIGFKPKGRYYFHPDSEYFVEFVSGPPTVGSEPIDDVREISMRTGVVRIISPTDSVKDRLAAYYHWKDRQALEQAVLVARHHQIDMQSVQRWSLKERKSDEFDEFVRKLSK